MPPLRERVKSKELLREMTFLEHLDELRGVLIQSLIAFMALSIVITFFSGPVLDFLIRGIPVEYLNFFSPSEAFLTRIKMSFVLGLVGAFPFIMYKAWSFIAPALFRNERHKVFPLMISSSILFYVGVVFCYFVLIPIILKFFLSFGTDKLRPMISISAYFGMVARLCFTFGLVFQLPIIVLILSAAGLVTPEQLLGQWRYAVLIVFVVSAILTPPDAASQVLMAVPVLLLYIGSVLVARIAVRRRKKEE